MSESSLIKKVNQASKPYADKLKNYRLHPKLLAEKRARLRDKLWHKKQASLDDLRYRWQQHTHEYKQQHSHGYYLKRYLLIRKINELKAGKIIRARAITDDGTGSTISLLPKDFDSKHTLADAINSHLYTSDVDTKNMIIAHLSFVMPIKQIQSLYLMIKKMTLTGRLKQKQDLVIHDLWDVFVTNPHYCDRCKMILPIFPDNKYNINEIKVKITHMIKNHKLFDFICDYYFQTDKHLSIAFEPVQTEQYKKKLGL